jgi:hypothetical protein
MIQSCLGLALKNLKKAVRFNGISHTGQALFCYLSQASVAPVSWKTHCSHLPTAQNCAGLPHLPFIA